MIIKMRIFSILVINLCAVLTVGSAHAEGSKPEEIIKSWSVYECYIVSGAIKMAAFKNGEKLSKVSREKGRLYVQGDPQNTDEFAVTYFAGFPLKTASQAVLKIDSAQKFLLYSHPEPQNSKEKAYAWSHPSDDERIINSLKKGDKAEIETNSHTGKVIKDTFALSGFTSAFNFMKKKCK
jgi:invasion protein IalB